LNVIDIGLRANLFSKFGDILGLESINRGVIFYPKEIAFRQISEKKGEAITEFINTWRVVTAPDWERQRTPVARRGINVNGGVVKAMPVKLNYKTWFWSKDLDKLNLVTERVLFWPQNNPRLDLVYTVNGNDYPVELYLKFSEITDESNVDQMFEKGTHFCMCVSIDIEGWIFVGTVSDGIINKIILKIYDKDSLTDKQVDSIILENNDSGFDGNLEEALRLSEEHIYGIIGVNKDYNYFVVNKDSASEFIQDNHFYVDDSTGNDGTYTIIPSEDIVDSNGDYTAVMVFEPIEDTTADGNISLKIH
jgi:hypothetical protein